MGEKLIDEGIKLLGVPSLHERYEYEMEAELRAALGQTSTGPTIEQIESINKQVRDHYLGAKADMCPKWYANGERQCFRFAGHVGECGPFEPQSGQTSTAPGANGE